MRENERVGSMALAPGVSRGHVATLLFAAFTTLGLVTFVAVATPFVLNAQLGVPLAQQGQFSANLVAWTELTQLLTLTLFGTLADRIGRRPIYALGFLLMGVGYALYPFATDAVELTAYRVVFALGISASTCMLGTLLGDYPQAAARGRLVAMVGVANGLGIVTFVVLLGKLPDVLVRRGVEPLLAGRLTLSLVALLAAVSALVAAVGLKPGLPGKPEERPGMGELAQAGLKALRNPRIALAYSAAFVARGDLVITGTFTNLWGQSAAVAQGLSAAEAVDRGRVPFIVAQAAALLWAGAVYFIIDRFHRVSGLAICMALAAAGTFSMYLVGDPLLKSSLPLFALLGAGEISAFFGAQVLVGHEAPVGQRGSIVAFFNFCGAIGILVTSKLGGWLFDHVSPSAPFVMVGFLNVAVLLAALVVRARHPGSSAVEAEVQAPA
jgi:MFS family permease